MAEDKLQADMQSIMLQLESGKRQLEAMTRQGQLIESAIAEINSTIEALDAIKETEEGTELLVSIGSGSFIKVSLKDNEKVIVGVGAGVSLEKKLPESLKTLNSRKDELRKSLEKISKSAAELTGRIEELNMVAQAVIRDSQSSHKQ
ncbi:MAG: prefoldin subunit alpha [Candidatus Altiarchaeota archaeon]